MSVNRIAERYAKSLLEFAIEQGKLDEVVEDVETLSQSLNSRDLYLLFKSPIITASKKQSIIDRVFGDKLSTISNSFLQIVFRKGREGAVPEMITAFRALHKAYKQVSTVLIKTAHPLTEDALKQISAKLKASDHTLANIDLETEVDPELIGGFTVEFDDRRLDSSVAAKLAEMRRQFAKNNYQKTI